MEKIVNHQLAQIFTTNGAKGIVWLGFGLLVVWTPLQAGFLYLGSPHKFPFIETLIILRKNATLFVVIMLIGAGTISLISVSLKKSSSNLLKSFLGISIGITYAMIGNIILWLFNFPSDYARIDLYIKHAPFALFKWNTYENFLGILPYHIVPSIIVIAILFYLGRIIDNQ